MSISLTSLIIPKSFCSPGPPRGDVQFRSLVGVLRLSHKYEVPFLYRRALQYLEARFYFPSVLAYRDFY